MNLEKIFQPKDRNGKQIGEASWIFHTHAMYKKSELWHQLYEWTDLAERTDTVIRKTKTGGRWDWKEEDNYEEIVAYRKKLQNMFHTRWEKAWGNKNPYLDVD